MSSSSNPVYTNDYFAAEWVTELKSEAAQKSADNLTAFNSAVKTAQTQGLTPPANYVVVGVDAVLVDQLMDVAGAGAVPTGKGWPDVFTYSTVTPPPPVPPHPVLSLGEQIQGGLWLMNGDSPAISVGTVESISGRNYQKVGPIGFEPMSPYPDKGIYAWLPL